MMNNELYNPLAPTRVAIYCRVSTEEQAEHGYSIEGQKETLKQYCLRNNRIIVAEYVDAGISGKEMTKRDALNRLLKDSHNGKFDEVLVWKLNRMSRNLKDLLFIVDEFMKNSIAFKSVSENFEVGTSTGRFLLQMLAAVGELERNTIVDNVSMALKHRARQGWHSGSRALGYKVVPSDKPDRQGKNDLVIDENEAYIIRLIFDKFCRGEGFKAIANYLNKNGYKTVRGNTFSLYSIKDIIDNPIYKGYVRYARFVEWSTKRRKGKNPNPIIVKGHHEAIITEEQWAIAADIRKKRGINTERVYNSDNILTSILRCPECGAPMVVSRSYSRLKSGRKRTHRFYSCSEFKNKGSSVCHSNSVDADRAEEYVLKRVKQVLEEPEALSAIIKVLNQKLKGKPEERAAQQVAIDKQLKICEERTAKIMDLYLVSQFDREMLDKRVEELQAEYEKLKKRKAMLMEDADNGYIPEEALNPAYMKNLLDNLTTVLKNTNREKKYLFMRLLIDRITVNRERNVDKIYLKLGGDELESVSNACPPNR